MRVLICGIDGYIGWALAIYLKNMGYEVCGIDNFNRRKWVKKIGSISAIPIQSMEERLIGEGDIDFLEGDMQDYDFVCRALYRWYPDAIVHLAEMPSAPYSMMGVNECVETHQNNVNGTLNLLHAMHEICPCAHLIKLGTMGEYGTPNVDIPEGLFKLEFRGRKDTLLFPRRPGSFYHLTKVHDTANTEFACRIWGLRSTDIMQGVVYGTRFKYYDNRVCCDLEGQSRFDFDEIFGTVINRFCASAVVGEPLTVYDRGGMRRGFLPLDDALQCLKIAIDNCPDEGEYRTWNQFDKCYTVSDLADLVATTYNEMSGRKVQIDYYENPRVEAFEHYYKPDRQKLIDYGYKPHGDHVGVIRQMLNDLHDHAHRIAAFRRVIKPRTRWGCDDSSVMTVMESITIGEDKTHKNNSEDL